MSARILDQRTEERNTTENHEYFVHVTLNYVYGHVFKRESERTTMARNGTETTRGPPLK